MLFSADFGVLCAKTFSAGTLPATLQWYAARSLPGILVAIGGAESGENPTAYSLDRGASWSAGTGAYIDVFNGRGLAHNGTVWSALGADSGTHKAMTSADGRAWTQRALTGFTLAMWSSNAYIAVGSLFLGVSLLASSVHGVRVLYTGTNGYDFDIRPNVMPNSGQAWSALATDGGYTVAVSGAPTGATSVAGRIANADLPGGVWTETAMPQASQWAGCIFTRRIFFAVGSPGVGARSRDRGATWSALSLPTETERGGVTVSKYGVPCATSSGQIILPVETASDSQVTNRCYMSCDDGNTWKILTTVEAGLWKVAGAQGPSVVLLGTASGNGSNKVAYAK